ncbi:hypothetical protein RN70_12260 [Staphylococcus schleiferi]|nr:hypothetical protein [Staphylococcus coagulans]AKS70197.1 hypothetical protein NP71_11970 [Staphylococcus schleiferi]AKS72316.1 hypothetical protein OA96_11245 [Staphylococcus schleiferi]AKS74604.1 hypothetical protein RN70_12260 [Staphylococcus schleiferi]MBA8764238.1 hypothetical protein [Staphylococcus coagulans]MBT2810446.1 hypothetical protein [Staphylococcus coagulans]
MGVSLTLPKKDSDYNLEEEKEAIKIGDVNYSINYNTTIKPFKFKSKYYTGLAKVVERKADNLEINKLLVTQVKNQNEQITLDDKDQFDDNHIVKYEETNDGKQEQKEKDKSVDSL